MTALDAQPVPLAEDADGVLRVGGTRVTLDTVFAAFLDGATAEEITHRYPAVALDDMYLTLGWCLRHRTEVETYLHQRAGAATATRAGNEGLFDPAGLRERLLARRQV